MRKEELLEGLSPEQLEKASNCKSAAELLALAKEEGVELTNAQLEAVNGGACGEPFKDHKEATCPQCNAMTNGVFIETTPGDGKYHFVCLSCGYEWFEK